MHILLTNDDGIRSEAMWLLHDHLADQYRVTVVAPDRERSAVSHAITLERPLRAKKIILNGGFSGFAVNGTPADCVKLALLELMDERPDLVLAGINPGANLGVNLNYSGTVAAAREAAFAGLPAISVSVAGDSAERYADAARLMLRLVALVQENGLPFGTFLNVNLPDVAIGAISGVVFSRQGVQRFDESIDKREDPRHRSYYWQGPDRQTFENSPDVDGTALGQTNISITPIKCDMTDYDLLAVLRKWDLEIPEPERGAGKNKKLSPKHDRMKTRIKNKKIITETRKRVKN